MEIGTGLAIIGSAHILKKILGPTADYLGKELEVFTKKRIDNLKRIFANAETKLGDRIEQPGRVPPKILKGILQEGSFCEDEITAEYFGGVLASSRSSVSRDDRGATFIALLSRLSSYQIRSHFIFYQLVKQLFNGEKLNISIADDRHKMTIFLPMHEYVKSMEFSEKEDMGQIIGHVLVGLSKEILIDERWTSGRPAHLKRFWKGCDQTGIIFRPSALGAELFLWGCGCGYIDIIDFLKININFPIEIEFSIPKTAHKIRNQIFRM